MPKNTSSITSRFEIAPKKPPIYSLLYLLRLRRKSQITVPSAPAARSAKTAVPAGEVETKSTAGPSALPMRTAYSASFIRRMTSA